MTRLSHAAIACLAGAGLALYASTRVWSVRVTPRPGLSDLRDSATGADGEPWLVALALIALAGAGALLATRGVVRRGLGVLIMIVGAGLAVAAITARAGAGAGAAGAGATVWPIACALGGALVVLAGLGAARHGHQWPVMGSRYERRPVPRSSDGLGAGSGPSPAAGPGDRPNTAGPGGTNAAGGTSTAGPSGTNAAGTNAAGGTNTAGPSGTNTAGPGGTQTPGQGRGSTVGPGDPDGAQVADTRAFWDALDRGEDPTAR